MARSLWLSLVLTTLSIGLVCAGDWNILMRPFRWGIIDPSSNGNLEMVASNNGRLLGAASRLETYCESWRVNVELHNIRNFEVVPQECVDRVGEYMKSSQYDADVERAVDSVIIYLSNSCCSKRTCDGKDAWIFDIDDTLISTIPYYKKHGFGGEKLNATCFEQWKRKGKAPAVAHMVRLYHEIRERGIKIFLVSSRRETLRSATVDNLLEEGYHSWTSLILRGVTDEYKQVKEFKAEVRQKLESKGYRIWGVMGDQWSNFAGCPTPRRTFKLPNSMYYVS